MLTRATLAVLLGGLLAPALRAQSDSPAADDVFYHFMPIAWRDSDGDAWRYGDFGGMTASLDYLQSLGVTAVWMNPIFPSQAYHGYQHGRADDLNAWFGNEDQWRTFVQAAHARGIKVFVDMVCYGISHSSPWFQSAYFNPSSPYDTWLAFTNAQNSQYQGYTFRTWTGTTIGFIHWDLRDPSPRQMVTDWAIKWLDPNEDGDFSDGVDGYRLDHVWVQYGSGPDGWGYNLDDFWLPWKAALQSVRPGVFTFAEQADWGITGATLLPAHDATFTKPFESAARSALSGEQAAALYSAMASAVAAVPTSPAGRTFLAIIGDHDVDRLASVIGDSFEKGKAAAAVLLLQPFPPIIYYGDELGMRGRKATFGTDANDIPMREPFKWNAVAGPPMSNYWVRHTQAYDARYSRDNDGRSVEEQSGAAGSLLEEYRALIRLRRENVALRRGRYVPVNASSSRVWAFLREHEQQQALVAINVHGNSQTFTLDLGAFSITGGATTPLELRTESAYPPITDANKAAYALTLPPYGAVILQASLRAPTTPLSRVSGRDLPARFAPAGAVATQDNATGLGDNLNELDQMFVRAEPGFLRVGLTGNQATDGTGLALLLDAGAGGQNVLDISGYSPPPSGPDGLTGTRLDDGFTPETLLYVNAFGGTLYVDQFTLLDGGGIAKTYRGNTAVGSGQGLLAGGSNPRGLQAALDNRNTAGVTDASATGAPSAEHGFELLIPYADVGLAPQATGTLRIAAFLLESSGAVSNQWLPGLGGGRPNLGSAPDLTALAGPQFASIALRLPADANCDGLVNFDDIDPFLAALISASAYEELAPGCDAQRADANGDGLVNFDDIDAFVRCLVEGGCP